MYAKYNSAGLEILAFPCNNFAAQEPGTNTQIQEFAKSKGATFPVLGKLECWNGEQTHPIYQYLTSTAPSSILGNGIKWNFAKFLVNSDGIPIARYLPITSPLMMEDDVRRLLDLETLSNSARSKSEGDDSSVKSPRVAEVEKLCSSDSETCGVDNSKASDATCGVDSETCGVDNSKASDATCGTDSETCGVDPDIKKTSH